MPDAGFQRVAGDCQSCAVSRTVCPGAQYCRGGDSWFSGGDSCFSVLAIAGASAGVKPCGLADFQLQLWRALPDLRRPQQPAQRVPGFYDGRGGVHDSDDAMLDCGHHLASARSACVSSQPPCELKNNENVPLCDARCYGLGLWYAALWIDRGRNGRRNFKPAMGAVVAGVAILAAG